MGGVIGEFLGRGLDPILILFCGLTGFIPYYRGSLFVNAFLASLPVAVIYTLNAWEPAYMVGEIIVRYPLALFWCWVVTKCMINPKSRPPPSKADPTSKKSGTRNKAQLDKETLEAEAVDHGAIIWNRMSQKQQEQVKAKASESGQPLVKFVVLHNRRIREQLPPRLRPVVDETEQRIHEAIQRKQTQPAGEQSNASQPLASERTQ